MSVPTALPEIPTADAGVAALVFAVDPAGCGGVVVRGMPGPEREAWLAAIRGLCPAATPWLKVPVNVSDDRLLGGLDFAATVGSGRPVFQTGLLEAGHGGVLVLSMAERLPASAAAVIGGALDRGELAIERDGVTRRCPARFGVVALDEGMDDEERLADGLGERLALHVQVADIDEGDLPSWSATDVAEARERLGRVEAGEAVIEMLCHCAAAFGIVSARAPLLALHVARALTALVGEEVVTEAEASAAARLVLPQRARTMPATDEAPPEPDAPPPEEATDTDTPSRSGVPDEVLVEAVRAAIPPGLLEQLNRGAGRRRRAAGARGGAMARSRRRGRPTGVRPADSIAGQRLNVLATLKAASPWQRFRRGSGRGPARVLELRKEDLHVTRFRAREETTTVFVVDASGSQAAQRLGEVKGAIELLLNDCYVRRDQIALIAFRGKDAETLLSPTRALARARRSLSALPGGGGTPLAAGLDAARELAESVSRSGRTPAVVLMTDGRANVARSGEPDADRAGQDALASARLLQASGVRAVLVDTSRRPSRRAHALAGAMGAHYVPLPHADAVAISRTVQGSLA